MDRRRPPERPGRWRGSRPSELFVVWPLLAPAWSALGRYGMIAGIRRRGGAASPRQQYCRCAICGGGRPGSLVLDHDHETGLVRGWPCHACNTIEGTGRCSPRFTIYRERPPAALLGLQERYPSPPSLWPGPPRGGAHARPAQAAPGAPRPPHRRHLTMLDTSRPPPPACSPSSSPAATAGRSS